MQLGNFEDQVAQINLNNGTSTYVDNVMFTTTNASNSYSLTDATTINN